VVRDEIGEGLSARGGFQPRQMICEHAVGVEVDDAVAIAEAGEGDILLLEGDPGESGESFIAR